MITNEHTPLLLIVSAPSGAGKTTLCRMLLQACPRMRYSVSCTTRPPRGDERDGVSYWFLDRKTFEAEHRAGKFLESAEVHGHGYGTRRETLAAGLRAGHDMLLDIDVQGAMAIRRRLRYAPRNDPLRKGYVDLFIAPPSLAVLEERLRSRAQDSQETIQRRLHNAAAEMRHWRAYQYLVINDRLQEAFASLLAIVRAEHARVRTPVHSMRKA